MPGVPLRDFCQARSGDKGNTINVAVFAPIQPLYEVIKAQLTPERVKAHFGDWVEGAVVRYEVENLWALNFVLHGALNGGGSLSIRMDNLGKCFGPTILRMTVAVPEPLLSSFRGGRGK